VKSGKAPALKARFIFASLFDKTELHLYSRFYCPAMTNTNRFRVFATSRIGDAAENRLCERGYDLEVFQGPEAPPKKLIIERVRSGIDGLITTLRDPIDAEVFEAGKGTLKVVAQIAVGFDNINRGDANKYKIPFTNTADVLTEATAEFAFFMMGTLARKMWQSERLVREQKWPSWHPFLPFLGDEVTAKTIAVIGTGRIGLAMIKKCSGFDMNILCYDPAYQNHQFIAAIQEVMDLRHARGIQKEKTSIKYVEFEQALRDADYVTIHVPLLREGETDKPTYHLINEKTLKLMKPTAYLINSSRGPVVDEKALAKALKENVIAGAALDVFEKEPLPPDSPLLDSEIADCCRMFHHFASGARITRLSVDPDKGMAGRTVQGLIDVLEGNYGGDPTKMPYVVNKEAFTQ
jgi:glyoxylate reductase